MARLPIVLLQAFTGLTQLVSALPNPGYSAEYYGGYHPPGYLYPGQNHGYDPYGNAYNPQYGAMGPRPGSGDQGRSQLLQQIEDGIRKGLEDGVGDTFQLRTEMEVDRSRDQDRGTGPFSVWYYLDFVFFGGPQIPCCGVSTGCRNLPYLDCCPYPDINATINHRMEDFHEVIVETTGDDGVVSFHTPRPIDGTRNGGCGICQRRGRINVCYTADNPAYAVSVIDPMAAMCMAIVGALPFGEPFEAHHKRGYTGYGTKMPIKEGTQAVTTTECRNKHNVVNFGDGVAWLIPTTEDGEHVDGFMEEFVYHSDANEFKQKWNLQMHPADVIMQKRAEPTPARCTTRRNPLATPTPFIGPDIHH